MLRSVRSVGHQASTCLLNGNGCFGLTTEVADQDLLSLNSDTCSPSLGVFVPIYAPVRGERSGLTGKILHLFRSCYRSEVRPSIVEFVPVAVIDFHPIPTSQSEQFSMQTELMERPFTSGISVVQRPSPLVDELSIGSVDEGVGSNGSVSGPERYADSDIIGLHRTHPPVSSPGRYSGAGVYCVNYTSCREVIS